MPLPVEGLNPNSCTLKSQNNICQRRIQDFPRGRQHTILPNFPENCMKSKEFGCPGGGAPSRPPLNPPLSAVADRGFPRRGVPTPKMGTQMYYFGNFFSQTNCMKLKKIGRGHTSGTDPSFGPRGPQLLRPKLVDLEKWSHPSRASPISWGWAHLRTLKAFGFLILKYAFCYILETLFSHF